MNLVCEKCGLLFKNKGALIKHFNSCKLTKNLIEELKKDYTKGISIKKLYLKYNISKSLISRLLDDNNLKRSRNEASELAHVKYPESFKHSEKSKQKMRKARLKFMKENPEQTAWRQKNMSYPEKVFFKKIKGYEQYLVEREVSFFPYFADFVIQNAKVVIEVDGSQHELPEAKERDRKKDALIISKGYRVIRFRAVEVLENRDSVFEKLETFIKSGKVIEKSIYTSNKEKQKLKNIKEVKKKNQEKLLKKQKIIERRSTDFNKFKNEVKTISKLQKTWGVSHATVRRWILKNQPDYYKISCSSNG